MRKFAYLDLWSRDFSFENENNTLFADEDVWLTQAQLVEIYQSSKSNISEHLTNIFADKELDKEVVVRKFRTTTPHGAIEGKTQTHTEDTLLSTKIR